MLKHLKLGLLALGVSALLVGCGSSNSASDTSTTGNTGTFDTTFATDGIATFFKTGRTYFYGSTVDSNGSLFVTGSQENPGSTDMLLAKYKSDGTLDTTFSTDGYVEDNNASGGDSFDRGYQVTTATNGTIYVVGNSVRADGKSEMALWSYESNGTLSNSFGDNNGIVTDYNASETSNYDSGIDIALYGDKIYVTGDSGTDMVVWSYENNGTLNSSFGTNGKIVEHNSSGGNDDKGYSIEIATDGKIYISGHSKDSNSKQKVAVWSYENNGSVNTSFGTNGLATNSNENNNSDQEPRMVIGSDGKIYISSYADNANGKYEVRVTSFNSNGTLNTSFGTNGIATFNPDPTSKQYKSYGISIDSNDNIIVVGEEAYNNVMIVMFDSTGNRVGGFAIDGYYINNSSSAVWKSVSVDAQNNIYAVGNEPTGDYNATISKFK